MALKTTAITLLTLFGTGHSKILRAEGPSLTFSRFWSGTDSPFYAG
jgi:hypothetical protein